MDKKLTKISINSDNEEVHVVIERDFSINNIEQVKVELTEILNKHDKITLELKEIENFDLTSIQLLYSLKKLEKKEIKIKSKIKDDLNNILVNSGFKELIN